MIKLNSFILARGKIWNQYHISCNNRLFVWLLERINDSIFISAWDQKWFFVLQLQRGVSNNFKGSSLNFNFGGYPWPCSRNAFHVKSRHFWTGFSSTYHDLIMRINRVVIRLSDFVLAVEKILCGCKIGPTHPLTLIQCSKTSQIKSPVAVKRCRELLRRWHGALIAQKWTCRTAHTNNTGTLIVNCRNGLRIRRTFCSPFPRCFVSVWLLLQRCIEVVLVDAVMAGDLNARWWCMLAITNIRM